MCELSGKGKAKALPGTPRGKIALSTPGLVDQCPAVSEGSCVRDSGPSGLSCSSRISAPSSGAFIPRSLRPSGEVFRVPLPRPPYGTCGRGETLNALFPTLGIQYFSLTLLFPFPPAPIKLQEPYVGDFLIIEMTPTSKLIHQTFHRYASSWGKVK